MGDTDDGLREAMQESHEVAVTVVGASDHTVTHGLYILHPDGNEIELYVDVPSADWRDDPGKILTLVKPLRP